MKDSGCNTPSQPGGPRGPADDGKRLDEVRDALDVVYTLLLAEKIELGEGVRGRGGLGIRREGRAGGFRWSL